jgi:hypothetical protein
MPETAPSIGSLTRPQNVQALHELKAEHFSPDDLKQCCEDIYHNAPSQNPKLAYLREKISECLDENLKQRGEIAPGTFRTGFSQVTILEGVDAIRPTGAVDIEVDKLKRDILASNIERLKHPDKIVPYDHITLENAIDGTPPCGTTVQQRLPITGTDGHGNDVVLYQSGHPELLKVLGEFNDSHEPPEKLQNDDWTWARAAWLAFMQSTPLQSIESKLHEAASCTDEEATRIARAAKHLQQHGLCGFGHIETAKMSEPRSGGRVLGHEEESGPLETILKKLTTKILSTFPDAENKPIAEPTDDNSRSHMRTLMTALDVSCPVLGKQRNNNKILGRNFYVISPDAIKQAQEAANGGPEGERRFIQKCADKKAMIVREGDLFMIRMPKLQTDGLNAPTESLANNKVVQGPAGSVVDGPSTEEGGSDDNEGSVR